MNKLFKNFTILFLASLIVLSPALAYAKNDKNKNSNGNGDKARIEMVSKSPNSNNNKNRDDNENSDSNSKTNNNKCIAAYGHLISFGWLKKNEMPQISADCLLPFGIAKKIRGYYYNHEHATTTPDTNAPVINNISASVGTFSATIYWTTNENSDSTVYWSIYNPVDVASSTTFNVTNNNRVKNHQITLSSLSASTTYYAIVSSKDASGNTSTSSQFSFTTKSVTSDTIAPVISSTFAIFGSTTAKIIWQTNELATSKVYYGTTTPFSLTASSTNKVFSPDLRYVHFVDLSNLSTSTTYYIVVESHDNSGNTSTSSQFSFTTTSGM